MKISWLSSSILSIVAGTLLIGCSGSTGGDSSGSNPSTAIALNNAYLSDARIQGIRYTCGTTTGLTDANGKFAYSSSECSAVKFTVGGVTIGSLNVADITKDTVFYPSDVLGLDRNNTSDGKLVGMLQFLQSVDSDNNPNNGINIDANTTTYFESVTLNLDANTTTIEDINASLSGLGKKLINRNYAIAHYEDTLRSDLNISVDTVPPAPAIIVSKPTETYTDTTSIIINGEKGAKIFVNNSDANVTIDNNNSAILTLDTIGGDINITSSITLQDDTNKTSDKTDATIFRPSITTLNKRDLEQMKTQFALSKAPRTFSYTPLYTTPNDANITFSEDPRVATTEDQNYTVTATLTKGAASDTSTFNEHIPFSQALRDAAEVDAIKTALTSRAFTYARKWTTGDDYNVTYSEPIHAATVENQDYNVTATITKGATSSTKSFNEIVPFSQALRDIVEIQNIKTAIAGSASPRLFTIPAKTWATGVNAVITFSEPVRNATAENQTYDVTATITKGSATDTSVFTETVPYSQIARDTAEISTIKTELASTKSPRTFSHTPLWNTGASYSISFSEPKRVATAIDQTYNVTVTIVKGTQTDTYVFSEFVPTTNVNITLGDGTKTLINDKYKDIYTVTNGGIFQKVGNEDKFIGTSISVDTTTLPSTISSSNDLLKYIVNNSGISLSSISSKAALDGSLVARYEMNNQNTSLYANLESLLASLNYSTNIDFSQYANVANVYVDFYIEYNSVQDSYAIVVLTDKATDFDNDIVKIINKDSIIQTNETIVNETETFTISNTIKRGDFIFVIDDSGSMGSSQASTINAIEQTFSTYTAKYGIDWKATVLGTEASWDYSNFASSYIENNITALSNKLDELTTNGGDERGLKIAYNYLNDNSITQRANSSTTIIYASDEQEHSTLNEFGETDTDFTNSYFALKNIRFNAIIPTNFDANSEQAAKMALSTGGERVNLYNYSSGYDRMMDLAVRHAAAESSTVKLAYPALASSITVTVDGVREENWEYDESANSTTIVFDATHTPAVGSQVVVTYSHLDYTQIIADAKTAFDANQTRAYTNKSVDITFNPVKPHTPLADQDQTYDVTVTFSKGGYSDTTTFSETVHAANFYTKSNNGWSDNNGTYVTQSTTSGSTSTLEVVSLVNNVMHIKLNNYYYDKLTVYINGMQKYYFNSYNQDENVDLNTSAGDVLKLEYYKYYSSSVSDGNTTLQVSKL